MIRFIIDGMLGRLARWLRLFGYEVEYSTKSSDDELLQKAYRTKAVLITSDESLFKSAISKKMEAMLIKDGSLPEKIAQIARRYQLELPSDPKFIRCPRCGFFLRPEPKESLRGQVPPGSFQRYDEFWLCSNSKCNKVYWQGSHWGNIQKTLSKVRSLLKDG